MSKEKAKTFQLEPKSSTELSEYCTMAAIAFGMSGLILRYPILIWSALLTAVVAVANMRSKDISFQSLQPVISIGLMSFFMLYLSPSARPPPAPPSG